MNEKDLIYQLYRLMCSECHNARKCHEECGSCEEYEEELERLEKENNL